MKISWKKEFKENAKTKESQIIDTILKNREIKDLDSFFNPMHPNLIHLEDLAKKPDLKELASIILSTFNDKKKVVVYTDYDADGITGGAIMWETLYFLGFDVMPYVPDRKKDGYGFSKQGIDTVKKLYNPDLLISVDHGISAVTQIAYARSLGMSVIITDHHSRPEKTPDANCTFHVPLLSGSGVAYFVAKHIFDLLKKEGKIPKKIEKSLKTYFETDYLALASIGTIADLVPLIGESRSIVYHGLKAFEKTRRVGIKHIIQESGLSGKPITPYEIGFMIAPRINAVGRLTNAIDALRLICTNSEDRACALATQVGKTNTKRQELVTTAVTEAKKMVEALILKNGLPDLIVLTSRDWNEGIIGLIASKIVEEYYRPTLVLTKSDGFWKGSGRSIGQFHLTDFLRLFEKDLLSVGGHKLASGFAIPHEKLEAFVARAQKKASTMLTEKDKERVMEVDVKMPVVFANSRLAHGLEKLAPYGIGNPQPLFLSSVKILAKSLMGKAKNHLKLVVKDPKIPGFPLEMICFNFENKVHFKDKANGQLDNLKAGEIIDVVYSLNLDYWGGQEKVKGRILLLQDVIKIL